MNIAICIDNNFLMQAATLLKSLSYSNPKNNFDIYILSENILEKNKKLLESDFLNSNINLFFLKVDILKLPHNINMKGKEHLSIATYFRILLPFILPESIEKILYLDCDMLVLDDITQLYDVIISDYYAATTFDMFDNDKTINERLMYDSSCGYFNAGMMLINLVNWKKNKISEKAIEFLSRYPEKCTAHDQDALNHALNGNYLRLSAKYNMQLDFFTDMHAMIVDDTLIEDIKRSCLEPCIIHFTGPTKPWKKNCNHPYRKLWDYFQSKTSWNSLKKTYEYKGKKQIRYLIKVFLLKLHIIKEKETFLNQYYLIADTKLTKLLEKEKYNG